MGVPNKTLPFFAPPGSFTKLENSWSLLGLRPPAGGAAGRHRSADEVEKAYRKRWRHAADNGGDAVVAGGHRLVHPLVQCPQQQAPLRPIMEVRSRLCE